MYIINKETGTYAPVSSIYLLLVLLYIIREIEYSPLVGLYALVILL